MSYNPESEPASHPNYSANFGYSTTEYANPEVVPAEYASFVQRFIAAFVDGLIIAFASVVTIGFLSLFGLASFDNEDVSSVIASNFESILIGWLYEAVMTSSHRQGTFGKMALGIKVTDMNGNRISFGRASVRHFAKYLSSVICLIGYILALFTERKQSLHDLIASTVVLKKA